ncbi:hypothetical protein BDM02DRAFT_3131135 [Thelephora ganbajun]|uniref:Uncharacterized protein n=1 Tax=Thelephora ganbajun TaxID=370292 RepID=A0ACB6Z8A0_THEGA|nr:hypothetical protein BDM02DRAFT_3131135 [Thelephora ganbajun]
MIPTRHRLHRRADDRELRREAVRQSRTSRSPPTNDGWPPVTLKATPETGRRTGWDFGSLRTEVGFYYGSTAHEKSEDPLRVLEDNISIDTEYFLDNRLAKPLGVSLGATGVGG